MDVILREDVEKLGTRGQLVKVAPGYARNFLLPKKLAVAATESNKKIVEQERQAHLRREAKVEAEAERSGQDDGGPFRSPFAEGRRERPALRFGDIARTSPKRWKQQGYTIERRKIALDEPIKIAG